MSIQKINDVWTWFKTLTTTIGSKKSKGDFITLESEQQIIYEIKAGIHGDHENLQFALVDRMEELFTVERKYKMCKEVIKNMYDFRISYFDTYGDSNDFEPFDFANDTVRILTKWLSEEVLNDGDIFTIRSYSDDDNRYGYYKMYTNGTSPIYINCHESLTNEFGELNIGAYLEQTIYHELTHLLQDVVISRSKFWDFIDYSEVRKEWADRWVEKEAMYCSTKATSNRIHKLFFLEREKSVVEKYSSFDFDEYFEELLKKRDFIVGHDSSIYFNANDLKASKYI